MSGLPTSGRPQPSMNSDTSFFWDGATQGRLLCQRCSDCGQLRHPPGPSCPACGGLDWEPVPLSGQGRIFSWVVQHHPLPPGFDEPAVIVLVELTEGIRMVGDLAPGSAVEIGTAVTVFFLPQEEGWTLPQFRLDE